MSVMPDEQIEPEEFAPGEIVKFASPLDANEADARFDVAESRGERLLIRLRCALPFPPVEAVAVTDVVRASGHGPKHANQSDS
jgi:hypothetical protein